MARRSYKFSLDIINILQPLKYNSINGAISSQLIRSATSIGANLIEATGAGSRKDYTRYHQISLKSSNETLYWLSLIKDAKLIANNEVNRLIDECTQISNIIGKSIVTLKKNLD